MKVQIEVEGRPFDVELIPEDRGTDGDMGEEAGGWVAVVGDHRWPITVDRSAPSTVVRIGPFQHVVDLQDAHTALVDGRAVPFRLAALAGVAGMASDNAGSHGAVRPPMTGKLESLLVEAGQTVARGDVLFVLEAMKMRNEVKAPADGVVAAVHVAAGTAVDPSTIILDLAPSTE